MKKVILISLILILICITSVYAIETANTFNIEVQTNSSNISKDQKQVTIDLYLKNYQGDGTLGYEGKLEYDKNVFETATITALSDWDKVVYDTATGKFVSTTTDAKTDTKIAQITLELKENVTIEKAQVKITNLVLSDGTVEDTLNKTITYNFPHNVKQEETIQKEPILANIVVDTGTTQKQETPTQVKQETPKQLTVESVQKTETDNTKAQTTIPQTGTTMTGTIIISIVILLGIIGYIKYRSIKLK